MFKKLKKFSMCSFKNKFIICRVLLLSFIIRMIIIIIPFKYISKYLGNQKEESKYNPNNYERVWLRKISLIIFKVCNNTPWESKCLVKALVAQYLLRRKNIESTLYLGVGRDENKELIAHAWLKCGDIYVTGESNEGFGVVGKFRK